MVALGAGALLATLLAAAVALSSLPFAAAVPAILVLALALGALLLRSVWPRLRRAVLLREAVDRTGLGYALFAPDRTLLDHNPAYGLPQSKPVPAGAKLDDLLGAARGGDPAAVAREVAAHEDDACPGYDRPLPDGRVVQISKCRLSGGEVASFALDVTAARGREMRARAIQESGPAAIWQLDRTGRTIAGNARMAELFGGALPATLTESGLQRLGPPADGPFDLPPGREVEGLLPAHGSMPERRVTVVASSWLPGEAGNAEAVLTLLDTTRLHAAQAQALHFAWHDLLTGLPNRARFRQALAQLATLSDGGSLLLLDMAGLRAANDALGQEAGDEMLREAARRLRDGPRPQDSVFHLGSGEFALILPGLRTAQAASALAVRVQRSLAAPPGTGGEAVPLRAAIGHASLPEDAADAEGLHRAATLALAEAKRMGNGAIIPYDPVLGERVARGLALREKLSAAVAAGAFQLAWQAQVDARTGSLRGAEALIRWSPAPGAPIPPVEFLPEAQALGLMPQIDAWVLDEALRQKAAWRASGTGPEIVGVNISPVTLRDPDFPARVQASLARYGVPPEALEVEIPEDLAARDLDAIAPVLHELIVDGVRLSLDDFGGGQSALAHLLRLPVDQVKLDRSIVAGLPCGARERAILRAVAALARSMEIPLLAEGVETEEQREVLLTEGCTVMQGWLFGRAVPANELVPR